MSLNIKYTETKPCTKPYELTLNDCLACSSCLTQSESNSLLSFDFTNIKDYEKISITPHAKINLSNKFNIPYDLFEDFLQVFFDHRIIDTSHYYKYIYSDAENIITSECPGVVKYIQRLGHHLIDNLMKIKSTQQIIDTKFNCLHVVTCLDKRLEESGKYVTTREMYKYMLDEGFVNYDFTGYKVDGNVHKTIQTDLNYVESIGDGGFEINLVNENWIEYKKGDKVYAKICGLPNFINFVKQSKKGMRYNVVEAYICEFGCVNGPAQIQGLLNDDKRLKDAMKQTKIIDKKTHNIQYSRSFTIEQTKTKTYKIEW